MVMKIKNSERLSYRFMTADDAELFFQLDQDPAVMEFLTQGQPSSKEDIYEKFLPRLAKYADADKGWGIWAVYIENSAEYIGWILVRPMNFFSGETEWHTLELGWRFFQRSWGKGYATEAANHIKNQFSKQSDYKYFCAIADEDNLGSIAVMKKIGMTFTKSYLHIDPLFECQAVRYQMEA